MLSVRWGPGDGPGDEAIGVRDALQLLGAPASDRGGWWLDVEDPTPEELDVVAGAAGTAPEHLAAQLAAGRSMLRIGSRRCGVTSSRCIGRSVHCDGRSRA